MSLTPHSPPETPLKSTMAVDTENLSPKVRSSGTPPKIDVKRVAPEPPSNEIRPFRSSSEIQVPPTLLHDDHEDGPVDKNVLQVEQIRSGSSENPTEATEDDREGDTEGAEPDSNAELPPMDWANFQHRYKEAILKANEDEDRLLAEFEKYFEVC
jgi:hypothetical protein